MSTTMRAAIVGAVLSLAAAVLPAAALAHPAAPPVRVLTISYRAHDGLSRRAYLILPAWYGPEKHPPIPLVISPHGRGVGARAHIRRWGDLPARAGFASERRRRGALGARSAAHPRRIRADTKPAAPSTGRGRSRSPGCRFRFGGAHAT